MQVAANRERRVMDKCRREAWGETWKGVAGACLTLGLAAVASGWIGPQLDELLTVVAWVGVGALGNEAGASLAGSVRAWREIRRMRHDGEYLAAMVEVEAAESRAEFVALGSVDGPPPAGGAS